MAYSSILKRLPGQVAVLDAQVISSGNPACCKSSKSRMNHYNSFVVSFCFDPSAVSYLRVLHSQNPVEPITAPY
jgi:hypothetical protein